jgi:hypothetical protein
MNDRPKPYVAVATFCERALQEKDNVYSLIRVIDTIKSPAPPAAPPSVQFTLMVILRAGDAVGTYDVRFVMRKPSGEQREAVRTTIEFTGEERGANIQAALLLHGVETGPHAVDILVDGDKLTSVPLRLLLQEPEPPTSRS